MGGGDQSDLSRSAAQAVENGLAADVLTGVSRQHNRTASGDSYAGGLAACFGELICEQVCLVEEPSSSLLCSTPTSEVGFSVREFRSGFVACCLGWGLDPGFLGLLSASFSVGWVGRVRASVCPIVG